MMQATHYERPSGPGEQSAFMDSRTTTSSAPHGQPPSNPTPKNVAFELLLDENSKVRARIPMRVQIYPHDTTDSIVTTVKNFYGIYDGVAGGVSFEDENGITLIARYENFRNNMTVYVRVIPIQAYSDIYGERFYGSMPLETRRRGESYHVAGVQPAHVLEHGRSPSRSASSVARKRSVSPSGRSFRSASQNRQPSNRAGNKNRGSSTHGSFHEEGTPDYSDSDGPYISSSKKARGEHFASSDISMDNILQDGRRKRPKFESSELPLFIPPQVPLTSISPQHRSVGQEGAGSPFARPTQRSYGYQQPLPSPQSYGHSEQAYGSGSTRNSSYATPAVPEHGHRLRERTTTQSSSQFVNGGGQPGAPGVLPTPDPTIASCISDEDVAMQLIRLGDASNFSHGRTSASTLDDGFSGAADAASSTGATSDGEDFSEEEDELPAKSRQKLESSPMLPPGAIQRNHKRLDDILPSFDSSDQSGDDMDEGDRHEERNDAFTKSEFDEDTLYAESARKSKKAKARTTNAASLSNARGKSSASASNNRGNDKTSSTAASRKSKVVAPTVPSQAANLTPSRKTSASSSTFQQQLGADEEDLSTKPRCQRCRKSKKGCDRQRPCGRCRDAGIGIEGCISEDEGNGRKGRYGRHMGVAVKKKAYETSTTNGATHALAAPISSSTDDKSKKRKR